MYNTNVRLSTYLSLLGFNTPLIVYDATEERVILDVSEEGFRVPYSLYYGLSPRDYNVECFIVRDNVLHVWAERREK